jgi:hypothetical protein
MRIAGVTWSNSVPPVKKPPSWPGTLQAAAVDHQLRAFLDAGADVALDAVARLRR